MGMEIPENADLAWDLDFSNRQRAMDFVMQFEDTLCVYSPSVGQLYTTYNMFFPKDWERRLVILPDPGAFHDTFHHVAPKAVSATGLHIIPGELIGKQGLYLANVSERSLGNRQIPFEPALRAIMKKRPPDDPFLPVLAKGDLRELEQSWPVLHLHRLRTNLLDELSSHDRKTMADVITEKLESLFLSNRELVT